VGEGDSRHVRGDDPVPSMEEPACWLALLNLVQRLFDPSRELRRARDAFAFDVVGCEAARRDNIRKSPKSSR